MEIVVALIGLAIVVVVAVYIAAPFTARARVITPPEESPREKLLTERTAVLTAIRDLDFDFQTGKLLEADYRALRDKYAARGVEILKGLDALPEPDRRLHAERAGRRQKAAAMDEIEAAVQARRRAGRTAEEDEIEAAVRARRQSQTQIRPLQSSKEGDSAVRNQKCPSCGRPIDPTDKFCAKCGAALSVEATR
jgi:DNA repair exonuclease SbcCD ATPase subunit